MSEMSDIYINKYSKMPVTVKEVVWVLQLSRKLQPHGVSEEQS